MAITLLGTIDLLGGALAPRPTAPPARVEIDPYLHATDVLEMARGYVQAGLSWVHVTDLDGLRSGRPRNRVHVASLASIEGLQVQVADGTSSRSGAEALLDTGAARIVVPHGPGQEPGLVEWLCLKYPGRIAVGFDQRHGMSANGWIEHSSASVHDIVRNYAHSGVSAIVVGPASPAPLVDRMDLLGDILAGTDVPLIAVQAPQNTVELQLLADLRPGGYKHLAGLLVGKGLSSGAFTVDEAREICSPSSEGD